MVDIDGEVPIGGQGKDVEIDETLVGGKRPGKRKGRHLENKTVILGVLEHDGQVRTRIVPDLKRATLLPVIKDNVRPGSNVHTD